METYQDVADERREEVDAKDRMMHIEVSNQ